MDFFATTDTETLAIFGDSGHTITIKRELTAADERRITFSALISKMRNQKSETTDEVEQVFDVELELAAFRKAETWLVDWTLCDPTTRKVVEIDNPRRKRDALKALKPAVFREIERVIDEHAKAREEKKVPPLSLVSSQNSDSVAP